MNMERRKFARYHLPNDAIFLYSNLSPIHGWVKDISYGGMAFEYTPINDCKMGPEITFILMADKIPFYLSDIPCKIIHDTKDCTIEESFKGTGPRRCGVQFDKLNTVMKEQLTFLLNSDLILQKT